jgi:DNA-binding YbaB/EbfC family protein
MATNPTDAAKGLDDIVKKAQQVQERMQKAQKEMLDLRVTGEAGAGLLKIVMSGRHEVIEAKLSDDIFDEDKETLEGLIAAAMNDAVRKIERISRDKLAEITAGMELPGDLGGAG